MYDYELIRFHYLFFSLRASSRRLSLHPCLVVPSIFPSVFPSIKRLKLLLHDKFLSDSKTYSPSIIKETTKIIKKILDMKYRDVYKWVVWLPHFFVKPLSFTTPSLVVRIPPSFWSPLQYLYVLIPCTLLVSLANRKCNA